MRRLVPVLATFGLAVVAVLPACPDDDPKDKQNPLPPPPPTAPTTGTIAGTIGSRDLGTYSSTPLGGATVNAGLLQATSNTDGSYALAGVPAADAVAVTVAKSGHLTTTKIVRVLAGGTVGLDVTLAPLGNAVRITGAIAADPLPAADDRADSLNAQIQLQKGSVLDASNQPVDTVNIALTTAMPNDPNYTETFPGEFVGTPTGGTNVAIESFGFVAVDLADDQGNPLHLDGSKPAALAIPVNTYNDPGTPTIPLWSLDEATGIWRQEGEATRDAGTPVFYRGTVTHFSFYNLDRPLAQPMAFDVTVLDGNDAPTPDAWVVIASTGTQGAWQARAVTGANGIAHIDAVPQGWLTITAGKGDIEARGYGYEASGGQATATIYFPGTLIVIVKDASGSPVAGAEVTLTFEGAGAAQQYTATTDASGRAEFANVPRSGMGFISATKGDLNGFSHASGQRSIEITIQ